jgi:hypothetical protein
LFHPHDRYPAHSPSSRSHYDPSQPRVPRGHPDGGQWTSGGYGLLSDLAELHMLRGLHDRVARSRAPEPEYPLWPLPIQKLTRPIDPDWWLAQGEGDPELLVRLAAMPWPDKRDRIFGQRELPLEVGGSGGGGSLSLPFRRLRRSPTSGVLRTSKGDFEIVSGTGGPGGSMPDGASGFNAYIRSHAEGHAVAQMIKEGVTEGTLYLNNRRICPSCEKFLRFELPRRGLKLDVVLPNGITRRFGVK